MNNSTKRKGRAETENKIQNQKPSAINMFEQFDANIRVSKSQKTFYFKHYWMHYKAGNSMVIADGV